MTKASECVFVAVTDNLLLFTNGLFTPLTRRDKTVLSRLDPVSMSFVLSASAVWTQFLYLFTQRMQYTIHAC